MLIFQDTHETGALWDPGNQGPSFSSETVFFFFLKTVKCLFYFLNNHETKKIWISQAPALAWQPFIRVGLTVWSQHVGASGVMDFWKGHCSWTGVLWARRVPWIHGPWRHHVMMKSWPIIIKIFPYLVGLCFLLQCWGSNLRV